ncbi:polyprenyl diphosphate synthase [Marinimicrobium alkaliphilum]|uniref:polyprenyl diphosphate synthase n=1 Tax=Marinimicrobium alkaliphilum TaxID=2202654 RepID=UPI000DB9FBD0|nr:polyprenyl diphosphate synthase [Marinimicrobium alkaliphilum]
MSDNPLRHIAIIMDGNNRWAKQQGLSGVAGHKVGVERIRDVLSACQELGVEVLTLFAFSSENWKRPRPEVEALMSLFLLYLKQEVKELHKKNIRLKVIGNRSRFSSAIRTAIERAETLTQDGEVTLVIAADYGGQWDIAQAAQALAAEVAAGRLAPEAIDEALLSQRLTTAALPAPDLLIRTGGEVRISNFLLWQSAYTELYFTDTLWPDFGGAALHAAAEDYRRRQRRFGKTTEQIKGQHHA